ncbi:hypothetical protein niasHS_003795 [Heterodera schachtii]|uniref:Uncharacterized protein n=2 Tax=Heterodera TaxID=34509 RepID=A0ABD2K6H2_HETSC
MNLSTAIFVLFICFLFIVLPTIAQMNQPQGIALVRRDSDYDELLTEFRSKGSRMRFGKRSLGPSTDAIGLPSSDASFSNSADPNNLMSDHFNWN